MEHRFVANADDDGLRLDVFLKLKVPWRSREHLKSRIRDGEVTIQGTVPKASRIVREGEEVLLQLKKEGIPFDPATIPLTILYEDEVLVALDKAPGFVVHPVGMHQMDTIINALHYRYRRTEDPDKDIVPKLAHRLDQHTSGVLLVAKRDDVRAELGRQFARREVQKEYLAIVLGTPNPPTGSIEAPIGPPLDTKRRVPMTVRDDGEPSLTFFELVESFGSHSLVRCRPRSGRTHQIRVHLSWLGHPLVADRLYGDGEPLERGGRTILDRYPLHSASLTFTHPMTEERQTIEAPLPQDMLTALEVLRAG